MNNIQCNTIPGFYKYHRSAVSNLDCELGEHCVDVGSMLMPQNLSIKSVVWELLIEKLVDGKEVLKQISLISVKIVGENLIVIRLLLLWAFQMEDVFSHSLH